MSEPLWTNLRATKALREPYTWHIEGIWETDGDPDDPESWGWVADVNEAGMVRGSEEGDTARALAHRYNAHDALVTALERLVGCLSESPDDSPPYVPTLCDDCREFGRAALALARGEQS